MSSNSTTEYDIISDKNAAIRAARLSFCDSPTYDAAQITRAGGNIFLLLTAILPHLATFPGTWRLYSRYSTAFYILLYIVSFVY